jgi:hypothetical protein
MAVRTIVPVTRMSSKLSRATYYGSFDGGDLSFIDLFIPLLSKQFYRLLDSLE